MRVLIVFYSKNHATEQMAQQLHQKLTNKDQPVDIVKIIDQKKRKGLFGFIQGGWEAKKKKQTSITYNIADIGKYDLILLGSPVWANTMAPAIRTFIIQNKDAIKQTAFFASAGSDEFAVFFQDMEDLIEKKPLATLGIKRKKWQNEKDSSMKDMDQFIETIFGQRK